MDNTSVLKQIGNTPLIKLKQASELTGCNIYGKAEYFNPGESVKDRAALFIVEDAIKNKKIQKGGIIVEGTAGNTGIGLAIVTKAYGLSLKIVIPKTQSIEKKNILKELDFNSDNTLFFMCRSGARSSNAAKLMTSIGWDNSYNVLYGFEGDPDLSHKRGITNGWKCEGLPWIQQ